MAITKQQKVLGAVVALGVGAVLVDQVILGGGASGPSQASAGVGAPVAGVVPPPVANAPADGSTADTPAQDADGDVAGHAELSDRLAALAQAEGLGVEGMVDAFSPRGAWAVVDKPVQQAAAVKQTPFTERHQLEAVVATGGGDGYAVIRGKTLTIGSLYDGHKLVSVTDTSATFEREGVRAVLTLNPGGGR